MSERRPTEDYDGIEPGLFTSLRPFAGWFIIATVIVGIAWAVLTSVE
jgi:hypothetical protein